MAPRRWRETIDDERERARFVVRSQPLLLTVGRGALTMALGLTAAGVANRFAVLNISAGSLQIVRATRRWRALVVELDRQLVIASRAGRELLREPLDGVTAFRAGSALSAAAVRAARRGLPVPPPPDWTVFVVCDGGRELALDLALDGEDEARALAARLDAVRRHFREPRGYRG